MSYHTILVHVDPCAHAPGRIALAAQLALSQQAHLIGAAMSGFSLEIYRNSRLMFGGPVPAWELDDLSRAADAALQRFEQQVRGAGVDRYERRLTDDEAQPGMVLQARYADLVVVSRADPDDSVARMTADLPEYLALNAGRPVLVVPYAGKHGTLERHALVAWDGSRAATRAITDALPLLRRSAKVSLAVFNAPRQHGVHGEQPGADIALFLARHGVKVDVRQEASAEPGQVGEALLSLASELGCDLLVMGAYGHQRWRELVLGGVTRTVLRAMTLPVLMSH